MVQYICNKCGYKRENYSERVGSYPCENILPDPLQEYASFKCDGLMQVATDGGHIKFVEYFEGRYPICKECSQVFMNNEAYLSHQQSHQSVETLAWMCFSCNHIQHNTKPCGKCLAEDFQPVVFSQFANRYVLDHSRIFQKETPRIPQFIELLEKMREIHIKKNKDYAAASNPFENFERSAYLMDWFTNGVDRSFVSLIATKLARLATLLNKTEGPENESIEDSFLDLCTYCTLWASYRKTNDNPRTNS